MLNESGIKQLLNVNKDTIHDFDKDFENYRSFTQHKIKEHNNETNNPLNTSFTPINILMTKYPIVFEKGVLQPGNSWRSIIIVPKIKKFGSIVYIIDGTTCGVPLHNSALLETFMPICEPITIIKDTTINIFCKDGLSDMFTSIKYYFDIKYTIVDTKNIAKDA